jgi:hypothetical protein
VILLAAFGAGFAVGASSIVLMARRNAAKQHRDRVAIVRHRAMIRVLGK